ncbi:MAG TPA: GTPase ObgE, partial [Planctomycetaceae bacterium]|nr:GTPase ObgE [Planctomycetaceae bacterium]
VLDWERTFIMADIPGLIEGASDGVGLGHEFLRHIERAGILVHLVEPQPMDGTDPLENYHAITDELVQYNEQLGQRPQLVAVTKAELPDAEQVRDQLAAATNSDVFLISSVTGQGLNELSNAIFQALQQASG